MTSRAVAVAVAVAVDDQAERLLKLVDSWSTREQRLAERHERAMQEDELLLHLDDYCMFSPQEQEERLRLARLVHAWDDKGGPNYAAADDDLSTTSRDLLPTFDVPLDYEPKCLQQPYNHNEVSNNSNTTTATLVDGPRLTFAWQNDEEATCCWNHYQNDCARLALLVLDWDDTDKKKKHCARKQQHHDDIHEEDFLPQQEREERARLAQKVDEWSSGMFLFKHHHADSLSVAPTFDNDESEDEAELQQQQQTTADDYEERLRLAKLVDEWHIGVGPYQVKHNEQFPSYSFDDILKDNNDDDDDDVLDPEQQERRRLAELVDSWRPAETTTFRKTDPWERFQKMMQEEQQQQQVDKHGENRAGCFCFRIVPHRAAALV